jgi:ribose/xylose/arabinose/galactoside ABC-type transport system permease subunit
MIEGTASTAQERVTLLRGRSLADALERYGIYVALIIVLIVAGLLSPAFYQPANIFNILRQASALGILSIGQTIVMIGGGIDLSVAAVMQLATVGVAELSLEQDARAPWAILLMLALSMVVGLINGLLVTQRRVAPFVATLFVAVVITGARQVYTQATPSGSLPPLIRLIGRDSTGPLPNAALIFLGLALVAAIILRKTTYGRKLYAVGGNPVAARLAGIPVNAVRLVTYVLCSLLAGAGGLVLAGYVGYADTWIGRGYDLDSIAAVVIGGTSLAGGRGGIGGTLAGVLLVTVLLNLVLLLNMNVQWQLVVKGVVIILAVALYSIQRRG